MKITRRNFLKAGTAGAVTSWLMNLPTMAHAAEGEDYKALVCVFLAGGNDHNNTVIPFDEANYGNYQFIRKSIAVEYDNILGLAQDGDPLPFKQKLGLHSSMKGMWELFHAKKMAVQLNVGPLFEPMTKEEYKTAKHKLPPKLFSHNDQQSIWQASQAEGAKKGWGGTSGDTQVSQNIHDIFSCISIAGSSVFLAGKEVSQLSMSSSGIRRIYGSKPTDWIWGGRQAAQALGQIITPEPEKERHPMEQEFVNVTQRAITAESILKQALVDADVDTKDLLPENVVGLKLGRQLNMVAKIIKARKGIKAKRQVFFVKVGGFDNHDNLKSDHPKLLKDISDSIKAFYDATEAMGMAENVTTFTASDFGRTFVSNGDGSDHGWGAHHFVVGGAVKGKRFYGKPPRIPRKLDTEEYIGTKGRLLPTTSVDQYAATLASWFGVPDDQMASVAPNLKNFTEKNLGFV